MVKTKSFKNNDEYFKFINDDSLMGSIIVHDLKLVNGKYIMHYENIPNENESESTDEIEWPSIKKYVGKNKRNTKRKKSKPKECKIKDIPKQVLHD